MKQDNTQDKQVSSHTPGEMESDYLRWFDNRKITMTGVHGGNYLDEDDFNIYGKWASRQYDQLKADNEKLKADKAVLLDALKQFNHSVEHEGVIHGRVVDAVRNAKSAIKQINQ